MANLNISNSTTSNMTDTVESVTVDTRQTDSASGLEESEFQNHKFTQYFAYYKEIPEVKTAIDMRAIWTLGKGFKAEPRTSVILNHITGFGMDSFNSILKNMIVTRRIGGDAYAEIIRDEETGTIINLKPLDPASIKVIVDKKGIIKRYEQVSKSDKPTKKFKPEEIFRLTNKRVADEILGTSDIEAIENIILANKESFSDMKELMHRYVRPKFIFKLDTDDNTKIEGLKTKFDDAVNKGENVYIPLGSVEQELLAVPANATLNPIPWREHLRNYFFQVVGIPQIILGSSGEFTESTAKIAYLAFQQSVEDEQLDIEEQVWNQLYLRIELEFPASLQNELLSDEKKDAGQGMEFQAGDFTAGVAK